MNETDKEPLLALHHDCFICGAGNREGLNIEFGQISEGVVEGTFSCSARYTGYANRIHGGIVAALLDGAMTHCLFNEHILAVTAELRIRYLAAVKPDRPIQIRATVVRSTRRMHEVEAEIIQDSSVCAWGRGKFLPQSLDKIKNSENMDTLIEAQYANRNSDR